jgi:hypothetical protein
MFTPALIQHVASNTRMQPAPFFHPFISGTCSRSAWRSCCSIFSGVYYVNLRPQLPGYPTVCNAEIPLRIKRVVSAIMPPHAAAVSVAPTAADIVPKVRRAEIAGVFGRVDDVGIGGGERGGATAHVER